jgi:predicted nuclease with RNAse H fold
MPCWLGIDVGGKRKGFDVAIVDERRLLSLAGRRSAGDVVELINTWGPTLVGIDSPRCWAPDGETARLGERRLNRAVCGIRWTPDVRTGADNGYYAWIREGLALFGALEARGIDVIEVFPTASWTRWHGERGATTRARWTRAALDSLRLDDIPQRTNQDQRDAIAAAVTARQHTMRATETFGEIVVPAIPA